MPFGLKDRCQVSGAKLNGVVFLICGLIIPGRPYDAFRWEVYVEFCAIAGCAFEINRSLVHFHESFGFGQAEACAFKIALKGAINLIERGED